MLVSLEGANQAPVVWFSFHSMIGKQNPNPALKRSLLHPICLTKEAGRHP